MLSPGMLPFVFLQFIAVHIASGQVCYPRADIVFLLDGSDSILKSEFMDQKQVILQYAETVSRLSSDVRVGAQVYSSINDVTSGIGLISSSEITPTRLEILTQPSHGSRLDFEMARIQTMLGTTGRQNEAQLAVIFSDGRVENLPATIALAEGMKASGIYIITVGVGRNIMVNDLQSISSLSSDYRNIKPIKDVVDNIINITSTIGNKWCSRTILPVFTTTNSPPSPLQDGNAQLQVDSTVQEQQSQDSLFANFNEAPNFLLKNQQQDIPPMAGHNLDASLTQEQPQTFLHTDSPLPPSTTSPSIETTNIMNINTLDTTLTHEQPQILAHTDMPMQPQTMIPAMVDPAVMNANILDTSLTQEQPLHTETPIPPQTMIPPMVDPTVMSANILDTSLTQEQTVHTETPIPQQTTSRSIGETNIMNVNTLDTSLTQEHRPSTVHTGMFVPPPPQLNPSVTDSTAVSNKNELNQNFQQIQEFSNSIQTQNAFTTDSVGSKTEMPVMDSISNIDLNTGLKITDKQNRGSTSNQNRLVVQPNNEAEVRVLLQMPTPTQNQQKPDILGVNPQKGNEIHEPSALSQNMQLTNAQIQTGSSGKTIYELVQSLIRMQRQLQRTIDESPEVGNNVVMPTVNFDQHSSLGKLLKASSAFSNVFEKHMGPAASQNVHPAYEITGSPPTSPKAEPPFNLPDMSVIDNVVTANQVVNTKTKTEIQNNIANQLDLMQQLASKQSQDSNQFNTKVTMQQTNAVHETGTQASRNDLSQSLLDNIVTDAGTQISNQGTQTSMSADPVQSVPSMNAIPDRETTTNFHQNKDSLTSTNIVDKQRGSLDMVLGVNERQQDIDVANTKDASALVNDGNNQQHQIAGQENQMTGPHQIPAQQHQIAGQQHEIPAQQHQIAGQQHEVPAQQHQNVGQQDQILGLQQIDMIHSQGLNENANINANPTLPTNTDFPAVTNQGQAQNIPQEHVMQNIPDFSTGTDQQVDVSGQVPTDGGFQPSLTDQLANVKQAPQNIPPDFNLNAETASQIAASLQTLGSTSDQPSPGVSDTTAEAATQLAGTLKQFNDVLAGQTTNVPLGPGSQSEAATQALVHQGNMNAIDRQLHASEQVPKDGSLQPSLTDQLANVKQVPQNIPPEFNLNAETASQIAASLQSLGSTSDQSSPGVTDITAEAATQLAGTLKQLNNVLVRQTTDIPPSPGSPSTDATQALVDHGNINSIDQQLHVSEQVPTDGSLQPSLTDQLANVKQVLQNIPPDFKLNAETASQIAASLQTLGSTSDQPSPGATDITAEAATQLAGTLKQLNNVLAGQTTDIPQGPGSQSVEATHVFVDQGNTNTEPGRIQLETVVNTVNPTLDTGLSPETSTATATLPNLNVVSEQMSSGSTDVTAETASQIAGTLQELNNVLAQQTTNIPVGTGSSMVETSKVIPDPVNTNPLSETVQPETVVNNVSPALDASLNAETASQIAATLQNLGGVPDQPLSATDITADTATQIAGTLKELNNVLAGQATEIPPGPKLETVNTPLDATTVDTSGTISQEPVINAAVTQEQSQNLTPSTETTSKTNIQSADKQAGTENVQSTEDLTKKESIGQLINVLQKTSAIITEEIRKTEGQNVQDQSVAVDPNQNVVQTNNVIGESTQSAQSVADAGNVNNKQITASGTPEVPATENPIKSVADAILTMPTLLPQSEQTVPQSNVIQNQPLKQDDMLQMFRQNQPQNQMLSAEQQALIDNFVKVNSQQQTEEQAQYTLKILTDAIAQAQRQRQGQQQAGTNIQQVNVLNTIFAQNKDGISSQSAANTLQVIADALALLSGTGQLPSPQGIPTVNNLNVDLSTNRGPLPSDSKVPADKGATVGQVPIQNIMNQHALPKTNEVIQQDTMTTTQGQNILNNIASPTNTGLSPEYQVTSAIDTTVVTKDQVHRQPEIIQNQNVQTLNTDIKVEATSNNEIANAQQNPAQMNLGVPVSLPVSDIHITGQKQTTDQSTIAQPTTKSSPITRSQIQTTPQPITLPVTQPPAPPPTTVPVPVDFVWGQSLSQLTPETGQKPYQISPPVDQVHAFEPYDVQFAGSLSQSPTNQNSFDNWQGKESTFQFRPDQTRFQSDPQNQFPPYQLGDNKQNPQTPVGLVVETISGGSQLSAQGFGTDHQTAAIGDQNALLPGNQFTNFNDINRNVVNTFSDKTFTTMGNFQQNSFSSNQNQLINQNQRSRNFNDVSVNNQQQIPGKSNQGLNVQVHIIDNPSSGTNTATSQDQTKFKSGLTQFLGQNALGDSSNTNPFGSSLEVKQTIPPAVPLVENVPNDLLNQPSQPADPSGNSKPENTGISTNTASKQQSVTQTSELRIINSGSEIQNNSPLENINPTTVPSNNDKQVPRPVALDATTPMKVQLLNEGTENNVLITGQNKNVQTQGSQNQIITDQQHQQHQLNMGQQNQIDSQLKQVPQHQQNMQQNGQQTNQLDSQQFTSQVNQQDNSTNPDQIVHTPQQTGNQNIRRVDLVHQQQNNQQLDSLIQQTQQIVHGTEQDIKTRPQFQQDTLHPGGQWQQQEPTKQQQQNQQHFQTDVPGLNVQVNIKQPQQPTQQNNVQLEPGNQQPGLGIQGTQQQDTSLLQTSQPNQVNQAHLQVDQQNNAQFESQSQQGVQNIQGTQQQQQNTTAVQTEQTQGNIQLEGQQNNEQLLQSETQAASTTDPQTTVTTTVVITTKQVSQNTSDSVMQSSNNDLNQPKFHSTFLMSPEELSRISQQQNRISSSDTHTSQGSTFGQNVDFLGQIDKLVGGITRKTSNSEVPSVPVSSENRTVTTTASPTVGKTVDKTDGSATSSGMSLNELLWGPNYRRLMENYAALERQRAAEAEEAARQLKIQEEQKRLEQARLQQQRIEQARLEQQRIEQAQSNQLAQGQGDQSTSIGNVVGTKSQIIQTATNQITGRPMSSLKLFDINYPLHIPVIVNGKLVTTKANNRQSVTSTTHSRFTTTGGTQESKISTRTVVAPVITRGTDKPGIINVNPVQHQAQRHLYDLCLGSQFVNDIAYNAIPSSCHEFVQCFYYEGSIQVEKGRCPFRMHWDQDLLLCRPARFGFCQRDPCLRSGVTSYSAGDCRSHYVCVNGQPQPKCCPFGMRHRADLGKCVVDTSCLSWCEETGDEFFDKAFPNCRMMPFYTNAGFYFEEIPGIGMMPRMCAGGSTFNPKLCVCETLVGKIDFDANNNQAGMIHRCKPEFMLDFTDDFKDTSGNRLPLNHDHVLIDRGAAKFEGDGKITIWRFSGGSFGDQVAFTLRFKPTVNWLGSQRMDLLSNCDREGPSVGISVTASDVGGYVTFMANASDSGVSSFDIAYRGDGWNNVTYIYDGKHLVGSVNGISNTVPLMGNIDQRRNPLTLGSCNFVNNYNGLMDDVRIYLCVPRWLL